ncbi:SDR family oxidoreductase [Actinomadura nitritigenes]|uniref:SDR family oxidoreductase n=1 Tax=Actinomadura nitritigenes TaxID=134602 RepID=UPI003D9003A0
MQNAGARVVARPRGIRVNSVAPGPIWTPLIPSTMPPDDVERFGTGTPLGRPGQPAELAPHLRDARRRRGRLRLRRPHRGHRRPADPVT